MAKLSTVHIFCPDCLRAEDVPAIKKRDLKRGVEYHCSRCNEESSVVDPSTPEFNPEILASLRCQLWKHYDLELDVEGWECVFATETKPEQIPADGIYRVYGSTEKHPMVCRLIRCKMLRDKVEDLSLHDGYDFTEPTTSPEQQEAR